MADSYVETVAGELADLTLADAASSGDDNIVEAISEILGASSQTLQEAFLTAVRVRRAEARARELLARRAGQPTRVKSRLLPDEDSADKSPGTIELGNSASETTAPTTPVTPEAPEPPQSEEDAAFADVLNTLDEFLQSDDPEESPKPGIRPSRPSRS
jgi:hypothetical protein